MQEKIKTLVEFLEESDMQGKIKTLMELCLKYGVPFFVDGEYLSLDYEAGSLAGVQVGYDNIFYRNTTSRDFDKVDGLIEFVENIGYEEQPDYDYNIDWEALWLGKVNYVFFGSYGEIDVYEGLI